MKRLTLIVCLVLVISLAELVTGCNSGGSHPNRIASITITPGSASIAVGKTEQFSGYGTANDGSKLTGTGATWASSNTAVATIDQNGLATAVSAGTTAISATVQTGGGSVTGTATLTVTTPTVTSVTVTPATPTMIAGQMQQLSAQAAYSDGTSKDVTSTAIWSSQSQSVATVSGSGVVTAVGTGQDTIVATFSGVQGTVSISVQAITSIAITPGSVTIWLNSTQQLNAIATLTDGSALDITNTAVWTSSAPASATVTGGSVTGVAAGNATITSTAAGVSSSAAISVSSSSTGITAYDDLTDSRLMTFWPGDGSSITYFGTRNSDGSFASIGGFTAHTVNQQSVTFSLDDLGRESSALFSDGTMLAFDWSSPSNPSIIVFPTDRTQVRTFTTAAAVPLSASLLKPSGQLMAIPESTSAGNAGAGPVAMVSVNTDCGSGPLPEDNAHVLVKVQYAFGGSPDPIPARWVGSGEYEAALPSGPSSLTPDVLNSSASKALASLCSLPLPDLGDASLCGPAAQACGTAATVLAWACKAQSYTSKFFSIANRLNSATPPQVQAVVYLDDDNIGTNAILESKGSGQYTFQTDPAIKCIVNKVNLSPASQSVAQNSTVPLAATALWTDTDLGNHLVTTSTLKWSWDPAPNDNYLQVNPITSGTSATLANHFGAVLAMITGLSPTGANPDTVMATESTSGQKGNATIAVTNPVPTLALTVTWTTSGIWNGTEVLTINKDGTWSFAGNLTSNQGSLTTHTETGSGAGETPAVLGAIPPNSPVPFTFTVNEYYNFTNVSGPNVTSGSWNTPDVTIEATPTTGGYSLSTNTTYPVGIVAGGSTTTVSATGFLSTN